MGTWAAFLGQLRAVNVVLCSGKKPSRRSRLLLYLLLITAMDCLGCWTDSCCLESQCWLCLPQELVMVPAASSSRQPLRNWDRAPRYLSSATVGMLECLPLTSCSVWLGLVERGTWWTYWMRNLMRFVQLISQGSAPRHLVCTCQSTYSTCARNSSRPSWRLLLSQALSYCGLGKRFSRACIRATVPAKMFWITCSMIFLNAKPFVTYTHYSLEFPGSIALQCRLQKSCLHPHSTGATPSCSWQGTSPDAVHVEFFVAGFGALSQESVTRCCPSCCFHWA